MYAIRKTFEFSAAHRLEWVPEDHPCYRNHGHNYAVTLRFEADALDELGFVIDTHRLAFFRRYLDQHCEHQNLNESLKMLEGQTTGERIALHFSEVVRDELAQASPYEATWKRAVGLPVGATLVMVRVCETDTVCAEWWE